MIYELFEEGDEKQVVALLELFLEFSADVNPTSAEPGELLFEALASGNKDAVKLLVDHGADCNVISPIELLLSYGGEW